MKTEAGPKPPPPGPQPVPALAGAAAQQAGADVAAVKMDPGAPGTMQAATAAIAAAAAAAAAASSASTTTSFPAAVPSAQVPQMQPEGSQAPAQAAAPGMPPTRHGSWTCMLSSGQGTAMSQKCCRNLFDNVACAGGPVEASNMGPPPPVPPGQAQGLPKLLSSGPAPLPTLLSQHSGPPVHAPGQNIGLAPFPQVLLLCSCHCLLQIRVMPSCGTHWTGMEQSSQGFLVSNVRMSLLLIILMEMPSLACVSLRCAVVVTGATGRHCRETGRE
jgi:hypothetical protein